jgi:hypothetical protein
MARLPFRWTRPALSLHPHTSCCTTLGISTLSLCLLSGAPAIADDVITQADARQLRQELRERDRIIAELLARVSELERRMDGDTTPPASTRRRATARTRTAQIAAPAPAATPTPTPTPEPVSSAVAPPAPTGPGAVAVDAQAAERALERTLTAEGALLLPAGSYDFEPYFNYNRRVNDGPTLVQTDAGILARSFGIRRNEFDLGLRARVGLPYDAQLELDLPYRSVNQELLRPTGLAGFDSTENTGSAIGDIRLGVAKTLSRESGWQPDLVGRLTWNTGTGDTVDQNVPMGDGFNRLRASLTALKRQDPLAFTASLAYQTTFEKDGIQPGNELGLSFGVSLAASPETSLSLALAQSFTAETELNGRTVTGSDQVSGVLLLGASSVINRQTLLLVTGAIGLTDDAPDYGISISLPIRF